MIAVINLFEKYLPLYGSASHSGYFLFQIFGVTVTMMADFYSVLGVVKDASEDEIKKVYKMLVRKWHPDKNRDNQKEATIKMQQICEAYLILGDGEKRTYYDMKMMFGEDEKNESEEENESYESDEATDDEDVEEDETGYESSKSKMMLSRRDQMMKKKSK